MTVGFRQLQKRIPILQRRFLPPRRPLGDYTQAQQDYIRAFVVLSHAEIEAYIEGLAEYMWEALFEELSTYSPATPFVSHHAYQVFQDTQKKIAGNHGLKAANIRDLLEPFGLRAHDMDLIDPSFLSKLSSFGVLRGQVAHGASAQQLGLKKSLDSHRIQGQLADLLASLTALDQLAERRVLSGLLLFK